MNEIDEHAKRVWEFLQKKDTLEKSDIIFLLGNNDTRTAEHAAQLYLDHWAPKIVVSGGTNDHYKLQKSDWHQTEAEHLSQVIQAAGVPSDAIVLEKTAKNTGENVKKTYSVLKKSGMTPTKLILVQKPYMGLRSWATFVEQWRGADYQVIVSTPDIDYKDYPSKDIPKEFFLNNMVGDMQRMKEYAKKGFQKEVDIPDEVWESFKYLVAAGYNKYLI